MRIEPLFPGYAFARPAGESWVFLKSTFGIQDVLMSTGEMPARVPAAEIAGLMMREEDGIVRLPPLGFRQGEALHIEDGPFLGLTGIYDGMASRDRVFVLLSVLGRQVRVGLGARSVSRA
jgi:transcriptional antiterminator RfaH